MRPQPYREWRAKFLGALAQTGNVLAATTRAGIDRTTAYKRRYRDGKFAAAWDQALEDAADLLEIEARRRATKGVARPVFQGGKHVGDVTEYSDTLLMFLLRGANPKKYREPRPGAGDAPAVSTPDEGGAVQLIEVVVPPPADPPADGG